MEFSQVMGSAVIIVTSGAFFIFIAAYIVYLNIDRKRWKSTAMQYRKITENYKRSAEEKIFEKTLLLNERFRVINADPLQKREFIKMLENNKE